MSPSPTETVIERLRQHGCNPHKQAHGWSSKCPAHEDRKPSLTVTEGTREALGGTVLNCHAGCTTESICQALGLTVADLFAPRAETNGHKPIAVYPYTDEAGALLYEVLRFPGKDFKQRRPDGIGGYLHTLGDVRRVIYRLPAVIAAVDEGQPVWIVEGEKDVAALGSAGVVATCNSGGAKAKWQPWFSEILAGADVTIVADSDDVGRARASEIAETLMATARTLRIVEAAEGKDAADHLQAGRSLDEFMQVWPIREPGHEEKSSSWKTVDLEPIIDGTIRRPEPNVLRRDDGNALLYPGRINAIYGEPEAGKGWIACEAVRQCLDAGERVLYIDFEDDEHGMIERLQSLGCDDDRILANFNYIRPYSPPSSEDMEALHAFAAEEFALVIADGVTEAMSLFDLDPHLNVDIAAFHAKLLRPLAIGGAAVLTIDHVIKDPKVRGRWAIGGQHKLAALDGAAYLVESVLPFGRGLSGTTKMTITKDRHGYIRGHSGGSLAAEVKLTSSPDATVEVTMHTTSTARAHAGADEEFRPTGIMEKVSKYLESAGEARSTEICADVQSKREYVLLAIRILEAEGFTTIRTQGRAKLYESKLPYRKADDPDGES